MPTFKQSLVVPSRKKKRNSPNPYKRMPTRADLWQREPDKGIPAPPGEGLQGLTWREGREEINEIRTYRKKNQIQGVFFYWVIEIIVIKSIILVQLTRYFQRLFLDRCAL